MQQRLACLAAILLLLSGCAAEEKLPPLAPLPPLVGVPAAAPAEATSERPERVVVPEIPSRLSTVSPLPPRPPLYQLPPPAVSAPVGASPNLGPVTGYGPGGMGTIPGSPANPPYH